MPIPSTVNPDLERERLGASFRKDELAEFLYGGAEKLQMKRLIEAEIYEGLSDPMENSYLSYEEIHTKAVKDSIATVRMLKSLNNRLHTESSEMTFLSGLMGEAQCPLGNPLAVHFMMFIRAMKGQGSPELYEKFGRRAENCEIIGTYAQTELGHGTFLRGLETRADFDRQTDEFVLNTPTLTSYKWWPGGLGHTANYCIVVAQLFIEDDPKGVQMFLLQVRDEETHLPLPGIEVGEIGRKIGMMGVNNGYLGLKDVRIPRTQMLMKNAQVLADGTFIKSPVSQLNYFPMVIVRCTVVIFNSTMLMQAATIATRYSAVRRQSPIDPKEPEPQVLDHVTQQLKVLPEIAIGLGYFLASLKLWKLYNDTATAIANKDYSRLPELHALACTLKASCSYDSAFGVERLRQACGGHGYLAAANLGNIFTNATAACTYEGENSVLYLQVGRILMKAWADVLAGNELMPTMAYLSECAALQNFPKWTGSWACLVKALQYTAANKTRLAFRSLQARLNDGQIQEVANNNTAVEFTQAAELHGRAFVANTFLEEVVGIGSAKRSREFNKVLENLLELYLIHTVQRHMGDVLRFIPLCEDDLTDLQTRLEWVLKRIRPDAVAICDGFDFSDATLHSALGSYDGNVYERIYESAKMSPLNKEPVPKSFALHLKPFMRSKL